MAGSKIEWCDKVWNPVRGCKHGCSWCYARRFHHRQRSNPKLKSKYDFPFNEPRFFPEMLAQPLHWRKPARIFVGSMCDLFGDWVPDEWIERVFQACEKAPWHTYCFLTKNPKRFCLINYSIKWWLGFSSCGGYHFIDGLKDMPELVKGFVSLEPLQKYANLLNTTNIDKLKWIIVGSETRNGKPVSMPKREWILDIRKQCDDLHIPLFEKNSLQPLDLPGGLRQEWPE